MTRPFQRLSRTLIPTAVLVAALAGCAAPATSPNATPAAPAAETFSPLSAATATNVSTNFTTPWSLVFAGRTPLVSERDTGRILELGADGAKREVGTVDGIEHGGEGGLLGLAIDGQDRLYAYSTGASGNRIERYQLTGEPGSLGLGARDTILDGLPAARYHNGGRIAFGPDGMLYAGVGDAGQAPAAQNLDSLAGKILRMTADGGVPDDNPYADSLVYSLGHRNVQGLGWSADGTMFASEFGQNTWDELNIIEAGGNYGWPEVEGSVGEEGFIDPQQQWAPAEASPSGIAVVDETVFIANLRGEVLRAVPVSEPSTFVDYYEGEYGRLRAVAPGPDGALWFVTGNTNSRLEPRDGDDRIVSVERR